eukprot:6152318-Prymnesium_polylepis.1
MGSARGALEFKSIMDATPPDLKTSPTNLYSQNDCDLSQGWEAARAGAGQLGGAASGLCASHSRRKCFPGTAWQRWQAPQNDSFVCEGKVKTERHVGTRAGMSSC